MTELNLDQFTGTSQYYKWSPLFSFAVLTDGTKYLAEQAGAYWLMDAIASHQDKKMQKQEFQVWKLERKDQGAILTCEDGNYHELRVQHIEYTDFPLPEVKIYAQWNGEMLVIFLPSEY